MSFHNFVPVLQDGKQYTNKDADSVMARAQRTVFDLASYYQEVGADLELLGLGLKQKYLFQLQNQDALRFGIHVMDSKTKELVRYETYQRFAKP